ncbi:hypothetical protein Ddye_022753 [Dipteronia dyeriana]|uniref:Phosphoinositide phospholipase C n=1 Tax=Dipteronia dyeriana TaxID=168575 RepID=A0AAD9TSL1_9ROSI|nr:hypothetical protein Ddye_022753 [Dipteronia dyeriana]
MAKPPQDIKQLFQEYSENDTMTIDDLLRFMIEFQKDEKVNIQDVQAIVKHLNTFNSRKGLLSLDDFFRYLLCDLNPPLPVKVHQDMEAPLSHYFLYTGHNSYLTGNQLSSKSCVNPIIKALRRGVRVIELDLWPNSKKKNDVKVCHGGTLTSPVDLVKCLLAIKDNAFVASEYPVVVTFEDHLTPNLQAQVAQMVMNVFGEILYRPGMDCLEKFPSPESLKKRVLISTKPPEKFQNLKPSQNKEDPKTDQQGQVDDDEFIEEVDEEKAAPEYRNLIAIHAMKLKGRLENIFQDIVRNKARRLSMSEQQLENAVTKNHGTDIVRFTQQNLLRVYPKGMRIDSSNYNPFVGWEHGAQMVAFNMQGTGKYLGIMQGMFRGNGGCGYVKKPDFLHNDDQYNVLVPCEPKQVKTTLKVKIYLGEGWNLDFRRTHFDRFSPPDFFVKVRIAGVEADKRKMRTRVVMDQWIPEWNQMFEFPLTVPELALLRISVYDFDDIRKHDFAGQTCLPVSELRRGIRAVPLHNREGDQYKHTRLLVGFEFD